jgi:hypothetical protein
VICRVEDGFARRGRRHERDLAELVLRCVDGPTVTHPELDVPIRVAFRAALEALARQDDTRWVTHVSLSESHDVVCWSVYSNLGTLRLKSRQPDVDHARDAMRDQVVAGLDQLTRAQLHQVHAIVAGTH